MAAITTTRLTSDHTWNWILHMPLQESVTESFLHINSRFEGWINHMYLDIKGLVTTGVGCLLATPQDATSLNWVSSMGGPVSSSTVAKEWDVMKANSQLAVLGANAARQYAKIFLPDTEIEKLGLRKLDEMYLGIANLRVTRDGPRVFPDFPNLPANAQMALLCMSWAIGPSGLLKFPKFIKAINSKDWSIAKLECQLTDKKNPGLRPRNELNSMLFKDLAEGHSDIAQLTIPSVAVFDERQGKIHLA